MRKLAIHLIVALTTFFVGTLISNLWVSPGPNSSGAKPGSTLSNFQPQSPVNADDKINLSINVVILSGPSSSDRLSVELSKNTPTIVDLEMDEDIDNQEVTLGGDSNSEYRILQRYRTSMTVMDEGAHLDLLDWRHFDSDWTALQQLDIHRFRTLAGDQMDYTRFPPTTKAEMISAVRSQAGKDWPRIVELVKTCRGPNDGCCAVSISSIYLRVEKRVADGWINIGLVEFRLPMGC